ncbi:integrase catalytic domain-containing protein [Nephila pilipes]|uniref:Integrase catalytic domain-containing protein n=1 Tax=Nephila pilipes TaxID=299642 RepID=A0A8X6PK58_NEPPI|nr:integrase catalytic domain-containing protein [Nephila pilipes]
MKILNRLKSILKGKISRIEFFIKSAIEETDLVETKVKLKNVIALQKNIDELRNNYYYIPNAKEAELASNDEELNLLEERLEKLEPRFHIEKYKHEFPDIVELFDRSFYVDDLISCGNEFEEALETSRREKLIMEAAGINLRKWITNNANLMEQWKKEKFDVHPVNETLSLGTKQKTKVLGLSRNTHEDYLIRDTKSLLEFVSLDKNTKSFVPQAVDKIIDPLGLISPFTVRMKCLLQNLWREEIQWDDPLPTHIENEW